MKKHGVNVHALTQLALLAALELVMAQTPLGMLPIGPINASLLGEAAHAAIFEGKK